MASSRTIKTLAFVLPILSYALLGRTKRGLAMLGVSIGIAAMFIVVVPMITAVSLTNPEYAWLTLLPLSAAVLWGAYQIMDIWHLAGNHQPRTTLA